MQANEKLFKAVGYTNYIIVEKISSSLDLSLFIMDILKDYCWTALKGKYLNLQEEEHMVHKIIPYILYLLGLVTSISDFLNN